VRDASGLLELAFCRGPRGRSVVRARRQRFPLRTTVPFFLDSAAPDMSFVYIQNPTGGVFEGDRLLTSVTADAHVRLHVTTQSATKLYRMQSGVAEQELRFVLSHGAYVEHVPDALIPQAGSRYHQLLDVSVAHGAVFVSAETVAPGRRAHGERFAYDLLELTTVVRRDGRELCADRLRLAPGRSPVDRPGVLGAADYLVTLFAVAPESDAGVLAGRIDAALASADVVGASGAAGELPNGSGALARILARDAPGAALMLRVAWAAARQCLAGLPLPEGRK
jgi:urease accessory protein